MKKRFCSKLDFPRENSREVRKLAEHIMNKAATITILGSRSPISLAAAAIYLAAEIKGVFLN